MAEVRIPAYFNVSVTSRDLYKRLVSVSAGEGLGLVSVSRFNISCPSQPINANCLCWLVRFWVQEFLGPIKAEMRPYNIDK